MTAPTLILVPSRGQGIPAKFKPEEAGKRQAQANVVIAYAKRVKDWPLLKKAVDQKIEDQAAFVGWWCQTLTVGHGGPRRGIKCHARGTWSVARAEKLTGINHRQVSRWRQRLAEPEDYKKYLFGAAHAAAMAVNGTSPLGNKFSGDAEWYTPSIHVDAARTVMGGIDLDPASNVVAQKIVRAAQYFTKAEDGLAQPWQGRLFVNPPYSRPAITNFVNKLCAAVEAGTVTAAVLLTNNYTDTAWWHRAASVASVICFTAGRINFYKTDQIQGAPANGQCFFYFGKDPELFASEFSRFGKLMVPMEVRP